MTNKTSINNTFKNNLSVNTATSARDIYTRVENTDNSNAASIASFHIKTGGASGGDPYVLLSSTANNFTIGIDNSNTDAFTISASNSLGTTNVLQEWVYETRKPLQPAFRASLNTAANNVTGAGVSYAIICDNEIFDQNSDYSTATGLFTAPVTGNYFLCANTNLTGQATCNYHSTEIVTTGGAFYGTLGKPANDQNTKQTASCLIHMTAGDTAYMGVYAVGEAGNTLDIPAGVNTNFSGILLN